MATSFVHFKFKSQKEPQRISFHGTTITVWDLKREIINVARLGDGTDFDLKIYNEGTNEEYTEDLDHIGKDSTVLARRLPAAAPGKGRAARYVSGKPPVSSKTATTSSSHKNSKAMDMESAQTEEEKVKAMFNLGEAQWQQKQEEMSHETRIPMSGSRPFQKKSNIPEGEPPHGYICYRCGKKGHWIQACPTNDDANYDNKNRIKRTTGIPRSMLKVIDQADIDKLDENERQHLMVNAEGQYVFAQADEKAWKRHLEKVEATKEAAKKQAEMGDKELQERGLECTIDKRMFVDPMKTPCCGKTYCHNCIENALIENDLTCPGCQTENVTLERLEPDEDMKAKIKAYETEKSEEKRRSKSPSNAAKSPEADVPQGGSPTQSQDDETKSPALSDAALTSKKRGADDSAEDTSNSLAAPAMKRQKSSEQPTVVSTSTETDNKAAFAASNLPLNMMPPDMATMMQNMQQMNFPMPMPGMPFMPMPGMMNPAMMQNMNFMPPNMNMNMMNGMNGMNGMNTMFNQPNFSNPMMNGSGFNGTPQNNMMYNTPNSTPNQNQTHHPKQNFNQHQHNNSPMTGIPGVPTGPKSQRPPASTGTANYPPTGPAGNKFPNQQRHVGKDEDNAYMRQPVNPHRHQNRGKRGVRQADYREL